MKRTSTWAGVTMTEVNLEDFRSRVPGVYTELGLEEARAALEPFINAAQ